MTDKIFIKVPIRTDQIRAALSMMVFSQTGITKDDFALNYATVFEIAARQIREAYGVKK